MKYCIYYSYIVKLAAWKPVYVEPRCSVFHPQKLQIFLVGELYFLTWRFFRLHYHLSNTGLSTIWS